MHFRIFYKWKKEKERSARKTRHYKNMVSEEKSIKGVKDLYISLYEQTNTILNEKLDYFSNEKAAVDIYELAKQYDIKIVEKNLESQKDLFSQEVVGYLDSYHGKTIYINEEVGDYTKRYGVAHEVGHYLVREAEMKDKVFACYFATPRFLKTSEEQVCDLIASFLLMPISTVLDLMEVYIKQSQQMVNERITTYSWLGYLGGKLHVADYYTSLCFQNIKYLGAFLYEEALEMEKKGMLKEDSIYGKIKRMEWLFR